MTDPLNDQHRQWEAIFTEEPDLYGVDPSAPARSASALFAGKPAPRLLELGGGQGRDTLYFARQGFFVTVLDYSARGIGTILEKAETAGITSRVQALCHDIRGPLPFPDGSFDGCYSHMLYCMALTTAELTSLSREVLRVLKPGGYQLYTVRSTDDPHFGRGVHRGEDIYETGGFAVHFFSREKVNLLARGFEILGVETFEEGDLPRRLFQVSLRKP